MPRKERKHSEKGIYHVMLRGWANQRPVHLIFALIFGLLDNWITITLLVLSIVSWFVFWYFPVKTKK